MPVNQHDFGGFHEGNLSHETLTEAVTYVGVSMTSEQHSADSWTSVDTFNQAPESRDAIAADLFDEPQSSARSLPFVDFRIYYKSRGLCSCNAFG